MTLYPSQDSFVRGEISPRLHSRASLDLYRSALARCENFLTLPHGGLRKRGGTQFVAPIHNETKRGRLIPFRYSADQAYCLEFAQGVVRVWAYGGYVTFFAAPWSEAQLPFLQYVQSADVMWVVHPDHPPYKITRRANADWIAEPVSFLDGPFGAVNTDETVRVHATGIQGDIFVRSSTPIFSASDVGRLIRIEMESYSKIKPWEPSGLLAGKDVPVLGIRTRYDGNVYECVTDDVSDAESGYRYGATPPTHLKGVEPDGPILYDPNQQAVYGVEWLYLHSGYGVALIQAVNSGTEVVATVVSRMPEEVVGADKSQYQWSFGAFGPGARPSGVALFEERLFFSSRLSVYGSRVGDFESFRLGDKDDDAVQFDLAANEANQITWLADANGFLAIGTIGGVRSLSGAGVDEALTPSNFKNRSSATDRCSRQRPMDTGAAFLYVTDGGRDLAEMVVNQSARFESAPLFQIAEHLPKAGGGFMASGFQSRPDPIAWLPMGSGELAGFTYQRDQEVRGSHRHRLGGSFGAAPYGVVEDVAVTPGLSGTDDVWLIVKRTIGGATRRYIEILATPLEYGPAAGAVCVDASLSYSGAPETGVKGLDHLEGQSVEGIADGKPFGPVTVVGGKVSLPAGMTGSKITVGLPFVAEAETLELDAGGRDGSLRGRRKRVTHLYPSVLETDISRLTFASKEKGRWEKAKSYSLTGDAARGVLQTGEIEPVPVDDSWSGQAKVIVRHEGPLPCTIRAMTPSFDAEP